MERFPLAETLFQSFLSVECKLFGSNICCYRIMFVCGLKVLPYGQYVAAHPAKVVHQFFHFFRSLAQSHHNAGLGGSIAFCNLPQHFQACFILGGTAYEGLMRRTVSMLCEMISGCASMTCATSSFLPWKSGISTSTVVSGLSRLISRMVRTQCDAPKSGRSSRSTEVTTAWESFIKAMDSATCVGSSASSGKGFPLAVLQNLQHRVQIFPPIMKVAVPFPQHSPILGQRPLLQMVCRQCDSTMRLVSV